VSLIAALDGIVAAEPRETIVVVIAILSVACAATNLLGLSTRGMGRQGDCGTSGHQAEGDEAS
jgi:hypothetical protein